jgi:hypothetical protein
MDRREAEQTRQPARQLAREKTLYRYSSALERGDFEVVSSILREAEQDPPLERMILEMNEVYCAELEDRQSLATQVSPRHRWTSFPRLLRGSKKEKKMNELHSRRWLPSGDGLRNALIAGSVVLGVVLTFAIGWSLYAPSKRAGGETALTVDPWGLTRSDVGVSGDDADESLPHYTPAQTGAPPPAMPQVDEPSLAGLPQESERLIIRNGRISMSVRDTRAARVSVEAMVAEMAAEGAYVISSEEYGESDEGSPYITMSIRVPVSRFDEAMDRLAGLAVKVTARHESGQDVTEEYVDLEARLESLEAARQRLLEIMQETRTTKDLLQAEEQLTAREAEIESLKGRVQYLAQSAKLASIWIELQPYILSQPVGDRWLPAETARQALETLVDSLRGLGDFMLFFAIAVLPWMAALGLVVYGVVRFVLWRVRVSREKRAAEEQSPDPAT